LLMWKTEHGRNRGCNDAPAPQSCEAGAGATLGDAGRIVSSTGGTCSVLCAPSRGLQFGCLVTATACRREARAPKEDVFPLGGGEKRPPWRTSHPPRWVGVVPPRTPAAPFSHTPPTASAARVSQAPCSTESGSWVAPFGSRGCGGKLCGLPDSFGRTGYRMTQWARAIMVSRARTGLVSLDLRRHGVTGLEFLGLAKNLSWTQ